MNKTRVTIALFTALSSFSFAQTVLEDAKVCIDCHGANGVSKESDIPIIAGASEQFLIENLYSFQEDARLAVETHFRAGDLSRDTTDMKTITYKLSGDQIYQVANYFSKQKFVAAKQDFDESLVPKGKKIHTEFCKQCHGENGSSIKVNTGILAGQWTPYLRKAFEDFRNGERTMVETMEERIENLSDENIESLLNYYASQQ